MSSNSHTPLGAYILTAYLPQDNWKKIKIPCTPGKSLQQVLEEQLPHLQFSSYCVYKFPDRSLLNIQRSCTSVNGDEITIELVQNDADPTDKRLAVAIELQKTEDTYLSNIQLLLENYGDPLKKLWGLRGTPLNELFETLSNLRDVLLSFYTKVEVAVRNWDAVHARIGVLFLQYSHMLDDYNLYYRKYPSAVRFLRQKKDGDPNFVNFIEQRRGAELHTLESLLQLPVSRIKEYTKLLVQLLDVTSEDHIDYSDLREASHRLNLVVQSREESIKISENESKLEMVQSRFHSDYLGLNEQMDLLHTPAMKRSKMISGSPSLVTKGTRSRSVPKSTESEKVAVDTSANSTGRGIRMYVTEGPVTLFAPATGSRQRYLFLFNDLLIVAKSQSRAKSRQNLRLKDRVALVDIWLSENVKQCTSGEINESTSFVIGWPTVNYIVSFSTPEEKKAWFSCIQSHIQQQQGSLELKSLPIHVVNATDSNNRVPDPLMVSCEESADIVLKEALGLFKINEDSSKFQLCVKSTKDDTALPLIGHEHPFSILLSHISQQLHGAGENSIQNAPVQFIVRRKQIGENYTDGTGRSKIKNIRKWYVRKKPAKSRGRKIGEDTQSRLFGVPLDTLIVDGELPTVLKDIVLRLYSDGPTYHGIFRKSANHAKKLQLKAAIEQGKMVDVSELPLSLVAALLTEFLRNVPGSVFDSQRYIEFVATSDIEDPVQRVRAISKTLSRLPQSNRIILSYLFPLLARIAKNQEVNEMSSANLAICLAPTLLWPSTGFDVIRNEVPALIIFMIDNASEIFEGKLPLEYQQLDPSGDGEVRILWEQDIPSGEHDLSGYDELEPESEEGAVSDSQAYNDIKLSPRKPSNRRYNAHKWSIDDSFYKPDSETPECSDEEMKVEKPIPPSVPGVSTHWQAAKPRIRLRTSESGRDRKERRRTIGGIVDGELLGAQIDEELELLQNEIAVLSKDQETGYAGMSDATQYSEKNNERVVSRVSRRRPSRRKNDGTVILGGLVGKKLVASNEEFASTVNSMETNEFFQLQSTQNMRHYTSGSDSGSSMGSNSSIEQLSALDRIMGGSSHPPLRHNSFKAMVRSRRKKRTVRRSNSLKEYGYNQHYTALRSNTEKTDEEKKAQSFQNIPMESTGTTIEHDRNHYCMEVPNDRNHLQDHGQQPTLAAEPRHVSPCVLLSDDGLGSSVSATPVSTLSRDVPGKQANLNTWSLARVSGNGDVGLLSVGVNSIPGTKLNSSPAALYNHLSTHSTQTSRSMPSVVKVTSFQVHYLTERPKILHNYSSSTKPRDAILLAPAKYRQINNVEKPQRIYYGSPDYYTDL